MGEEMLDLGVVCLICLREEPGYCSIYGQDLETPDMQIVDKIRSCSELQLEQSLLGRLPNKICHGCRNELSITYRFQQKCQNAHRVFQTLVSDAASNSKPIVPLNGIAPKAEHRLVFPPSLRIKRLETEAELLLPIMAVADQAPNTANKVEYYKDSTLSLITNGTVLQDVNNQLSLDSIVTVPSHKDDSCTDDDDDDDGDNGDLELHKDSVHLHKDAEVQLLDTIKAPNEQVLYEIESELLEVSNTELEFNHLNEEQQQEMELQVEEPHEQKEEYDEEEDQSAQGKQPEKHPDNAVSTPRQRYKRGMPPLERTRRCASGGEGSMTRSLLIANNSNKDIAVETVRRDGLPKKLSKWKTSPASSGSIVAQKPSTARTRSRRIVERPLKICDVCGNTYKYQHALNAHMRRHKNERPYSCEVCQKAFISNVELRRHMRVHTGQKPYGCRFCDRRFSDFGSSKKHERIHTGERPYVCEVCKKGFAYAHVLSVHKRIHTGKKQFQCLQCDKGFTKKMYLITHMEQHLKDSTGESGKPLPLEKYTSWFSKYDPGHASGLRYEDEVEEFSRDNCDLGDEDDEEDNVSIGINIDALSGTNVNNVTNVTVEEAKVLEECIVTNEFMFNDDNVECNDYEADVELQPHFVSNNMEDLLDSEQLEVEPKYVIQ